MDSCFRSNANDDLLWKNTWSDDIASNLLTDCSEQCHLSGPFQHACDPAFFDTTTQTTPLSVPSSAYPIQQCVLPSRDTSDATIISTPARLERQEMSSFQYEDSSQQGMTATDDWIGPYPFPETFKGGLSPAPDFKGGDMVVRMQEDFGHERSNSCSQVVKTHHYPELTSSWIWHYPREIYNGEGLENSSLSKRKRVLVEPRNHARGWHCPICNQRLKRRDYIKPHVKRKHPQPYGGLGWTQSSNPEQSIVATADCPSAHDGIFASGLWKEEERQRPMLSWDPQGPESVQPRLAVLEHSMMPHKVSLDSTSPDGWDYSDGSENESSSRVKTSHDNLAPSLACPFYKHYPSQHRKCSSLLLRRPKDVKQHIYRSHTQPEFYCARCYHIFRSRAERDKHWREKFCDKLGSSLSLQFQGIDKNQRKLLNQKSPRDLNVEAQWFQIYGIVFPGSEFPRSAYVGNCLEEMVPLLREKWEEQGHNITSRVVGNLSHHQLSSVMDLFFRSLEGEVFENKTDDSSTCVVTSQSQMEDNSQRCIWSIPSS